MTPFTYEDRYDVTLEADFKTYVPIPVVTLKPRSLDLEILEEGLMPLITFEMTNHGLIAAERVQFTLPQHHPFLRFEMVTVLPIHFKKMFFFNKWGTKRITLISTNYWIMRRYHSSFYIYLI